MHGRGLGRNHMAEIRDSYSKLYRLLVHSEDDITGQIAYCIYKQHKAEEIARLTLKNKRPPTDEELAPFMCNAESDNQIRFYNDRATKLSSDFLIRTLAVNVDKINTSLKAEYDEKINKALEDSRPKGFMYGVWQSVFASFIFFAGGILLLLATGGWTRIGQALIELAR